MIEVMQTQQKMRNLHQHKPKFGNERKMSKSRYNGLKTSFNRKIQLDVEHCERNTSGQQANKICDPKSWEEATVGQKQIKVWYPRGKKQIEDHDHEIMRS